MNRHLKKLANNSTHKESALNASTCELIEERIHELMDVRQPLLSDELIRNHIRNCDQCAELIVDFGALNESLSQIPLETIHRLADLAAPKQPRRYQLHPISFVASVACLLLVCLTSGIWFGPSSNQPIPTRIEMVSTPLPLKVLDEAEETLEPGIAPQELLLASAFHNAASPADFINTVGLEISDGVEPFQDYFHMTTDLPGIEPIKKSVNATLHIYRSIAEEPSSDESMPRKKQNPANRPDVGCHDLLAIQLCSV